MAWIDPCLFLQSDAHPARSFRAIISEGWDEGLMSLADLRVTQKAGGANFSVDVSAGRCVVQGDSATLQGNYMCTNDATINDATTVVTSAPSAGNERYDIVIVEVKDNAEDAGGLNLPRCRVVAGTPAAVGSGTVPATPVTSLRLAVIGPILNGTTSITDSLITQDNTLAGKREEPATIKWRADSKVPTGWLACDGTTKSRTTYARLFAHIGTQYNTGGEAGTDFRLPDLRGKVAIPAKSGQAQVDTIGETGGEYTHTMTSGELVAHTHTGPSHTHTMDHDHPDIDITETSTGASMISNWAAGGATRKITAGIQTAVNIVLDTVLGRIPNYTGSTGAAGTGATGSTGSSTAFNVMQPYQVVGLAVIRT